MGLRGGEKGASEAGVGAPGGCGGAGRRRPRLRLGPGAGKGAGSSRGRAGGLGDFPTFGW